MSAPSSRSTDDHSSPRGEHQRGHGAGHGHWLMIACCIPMVAIAIALVATGVVGAGVIILAVVCLGMMAMMMLGMTKGEGH